MNYYKQGDAAKADKIKAAFERLGYDITYPDGCTNPAALNIGVEIDGAKFVVPVTLTYIHYIIKTHPGYKELELPVVPKFKVGDWITSIDDEGDTAVERIVNLRDNKVLLVDIDGCFTEYPRGTLESYRLWAIADAKDGDVLHHSCTASNGTFIFKGVNESGKIFCYCDYDSEDHFCLGEYHHIPHSSDSKFVHPATKEQRDLLFKKMKEAGYEWDADKKELRKIKPHYDIANFYAGMPVLVRDNDKEWRYVPFSHITNSSWKFNAVGTIWEQCIPFNDDTKHLLGTTDMPSEEYINW